jgi:hypothetical protein
MKPPNEGACYRASIAGQSLFTRVATGIWSGDGFDKPSTVIDNAPAP